MENFISVDLEEWYHFGFANGIVIEKRKSSSSRPRIINNTLRLLKLFNSFNIKATFFVLGTIAREFPDLIKEIENNGHEIASHGYDHTPIFKLTKEEFALDLKKTLDILHKVTKQKILGYRAPYFSITNISWAYDILAENGFLYDSSIRGQYYSTIGLKENSFCHKILTSNRKFILEFPILGIEIFNCYLPFSGGTYFRILPPLFLKSAIKALNKRGKAVNIYLHPRDIDMSLPRIRLSYFDQIRYSGRFGNTENKLKYLFKHFKFTCIRDFLNKNKEFVNPVNFKNGG